MMDEIMEKKAEIFDIVVQIEQLTALKNQKLAQLQELIKQKEPHLTKSA